MEPNLAILNGKTNKGDFILNIGAKCTGKTTLCKQCNDYEPRNGKSGCCRFYTTTLYIHGKKITLKL